jgi:hypothetical protein
VDDLPRAVTAVSPAGPARSWSAVPLGPEPFRPGIGLAWVLAEVPLLVGLAGHGASLAALAGIAISTLVASATSRATSRLAVGAAVWLAAAAFITSFAGVRVGLLAVVLAVGWALVLGAVQSSGIPPASFRPLVGPLVVSAVLGLLGLHGWALFAGIVAVAMAGAVTAAPGVASQVVAFGDRIGGIAGTVLGAIAMAPAAAVVTVLWLLYRMVGYDPLRIRSADGPGWHARESPSGSRPERSFDPHAMVIPRGPRRRRRLAHAMAIAVVVALAGGIALRPAGAPTSEAFAHDAEWPEVWRQQRKFNSDPRFDNTTVWRLNDFRSPHVNQLGGRRTTWTPPPCECPRYTIWWFGGSAGWGFFQRDGDTIPSQLARAAWARGIALDIQNLAVPGHSSSQEVQLFAQMIVTEPLPDLAVFYDGANELFLQVDRNNRRRGSDESPASYAEQELSTFVSAASSVERLLTLRSAGEHLPEDPEEPPLDAPDVADHAMARYGRQIELARTLADSAGVPVLFAWQPLMSEAPSEASDEFEPMAREDAEWHRRLTGSARAALPSDVLDLSDSLDDVAKPVFPDWAHTNEVGARLVASDLLDAIVQRRLIPDLR